MKPRTSEKWCKQFGIMVKSDLLDLDGWNGRGWPYSFSTEKIGLIEFIKRVNRSTTRKDAECFKRMDEEYKRVKR